MLECLSWLNDTRVEIYDVVSDYANVSEDFTCCIINTGRLLVQEVWTDKALLLGRKAIDQSIRETYGSVIREDDLWKQVDSQWSRP